MLGGWALSLLILDLGLGWSTSRVSCSGSPSPSDAVSTRLDDANFFEDVVGCFDFRVVLIPERGRLGRFVVGDSLTSDATESPSSLDCSVICCLETVSRPRLRAFALDFAEDVRLVAVFWGATPIVSLSDPNSALSSVARPRDDLVDLGTAALAAARRGGMLW